MSEQLKLSCINDQGISEQLGAKRLEQLIRLYEKAFAQPPWYDEYAVNEVKTIIEQDLMTPGVTLILFEDDQYNIRGFGWGYPCNVSTLYEHADCPDNIDLLNQVIRQSFPQDQSVYYISEVVVREDTRGKRLGSTIVQLLLQQANGMPTYMYTHQLSPMVVLAESNGMEEIISAGSLSQNPNLVLYRLK